MDRWSLNKLSIETYNVPLEGDLIKEIFIPIRDRKKFTYSSNTVSIPRYFYRIIGIEDKEDDYYNFLYDLNKELSKLKRLYLGITDGFIKDIDTKTLNELNTIWNKICCFEDITPSSVVNTIKNADILIEFPNKVLETQISENLEGLIEYYFELNNDEIDPNEFKEILFYCINWINIYFQNLFLDFDYTDINPKVLYYGDIEVKEVFFLIFLSSLGCDIFYFNPLSDDVFSKIDKNGIFSLNKELNRKLYPQLFPTNRVISRSETAAFQASQELRQTLHSDNSYCYKPWQYTDYNVAAITLKSTYEEVYIWGKQNAMIRQNFVIEDNTVYIPNIFCKISGTHSTLSKYWKEINEFTSMEETTFFKKLPISKDAQMEVNKYYEVLNDKGLIDTKKLRNISWWPYKQLRTSLQIIIADRISSLCANPRVMNNLISNTDELKVKIFSKLIDIEENFLEILQKFDYPFSVPKIVIYNNEKNGELSFWDAIILTFMNTLGVDIIIYNPSGYNDIENYIYERYYDTHKLEKMTFNLQYKENFFSKLFS